MKFFASSPLRQYLFLGSALILTVAMVAILVFLEAASQVDPRALAAVPGPLVVDRQGQILRLGAGPQGLRLVKLPPEKIPPLVAAAFLAAEDQRFWQHPGVDALAVLRAAAQNLAAGRIVSGASTITMQLARLAYPGSRTFSRKAVEAIRSLRIEGMLAKEDILRAYLNRVPLGGNLVGVETAARAYFNKTAAELSAAEAALLAALAKAPTALRPRGPHQGRLLVRQRWVLERMARMGYLTLEALASAQQEPLSFPGPGRGAPVFPFRAPHFVQTVFNREKFPLIENGKLTTTLDLGLQQRVEAVVRSHRAALLKGGASQAAAVVVDNRTLEVLALVGSFSYGRRDQGFNNGAAALRSPGSTLKPFLYALALDHGFSPGAVLEDVERRYRTPRGEFLPANFDRSTHGPVPFREALGNSLNLSAVYLLNQIGPRVYYDALMKLELINHPDRGPEHYGLGLVVGNPEVTLLQLAAAYAALANGGIHRPLRLLVADPLEPGVQVFSPQAAYIVTDILADPLARGRIFGGAQAMNSQYRLAIKTGTSTRYRDAWCVAYSPEYTLAVWVGNFDGRPTAMLSGAAAAAPILMDLAQEVFTGNPPGDFPRPEGIVSRTVCAFSGLLPGPGCVHQRRELFVAGTEPTQTCTFHEHREPWLRIPTSFAAWLKQRHGQGGEGRFRLAGFPLNLDEVFPPAAVVPQTPAKRGKKSGKVTLGGQFRPEPEALPRPVASQAPLISISYPLSGDRFLVPPGRDSLRLTLKADCRLPFPMVTWFVNGREQGTSGPPYELTLDLPRGRHHLMAVGPDHLGDVVEVVVE
ncbi:MAG: penicillin-binding protein 1C [Desulfobaccales bacterium]